MCTGRDSHEAPEQRFSLRRIAVPAFGPSVLWSTGVGAAAPVIGLSARDLGASVPVAALFVGILAAAELVCAIPAGVLVGRIGERRALVLSGLVDAAAAALALVAPTLAVLAAAMVLSGATGAVFLLARQSYLAAAAPESMRARAMSTLGGVTRIGLFLGPFLGALLVDARGPQAAFGIAVLAGLLTALLALVSPELGAHGPAPTPAGPAPVSGLGQVLRQHRDVLLTVGLGVVVIGLARSSRAVVVPLWAESVGLTPAETSVVFGMAGLVEVLLFYPAGSLMDRRGRIWVALPVTVLLGLGLVLLPLTTSLLAVGTVTVVMGIGNGLGSGIVMTLGADAAPALGRASFLGVWRLLSLIGHNGSAVLVGVLAGVASIGVASVVLGVLSLAGGGWLLRWLPRYDPRHRSGTAVVPD